MKTVFATFVQTSAVCLLTTISSSLVVQAQESTAQTNTVQSAKKELKPSGDEDQKKAKQEKSTKDKKGWKPLFKKESLDGWKVTNFGGEGEVTIKDSVLTITQGVDLSGVTTTKQKDLPKINYEVQFEARRTEGGDFFIGFTFPVNDSSCSLICGGWGGGVCGISSIDFMDASENETTTFESFENDKWYKVRVKVTEERMEAWLDEKSLVDVEVKDHKFDTRFEMELCKPMGFSSYQSTAEIRKARIRTLKKKQSGDKN